MAQDPNVGAGDGETSTLESVSSGLADAVARASVSVVTVDARRRLPASGVLWGQGLVVTADHVVERDEEIGVVLHEGETAPATLIGRDPGSDLALLRLGSEAGAATAVRPPAAPPDAARVGQLVLALGRPGRDVQASLGIISAIGGRWRSRGGARIEGWLRPDVDFLPGFSGGPLIDVSGRFIGINSSRFRPGGGLTIPAAIVERVTDALASHGRIRRAYLGIASQATRLAGPAAERAGGRERGLLVTGVEQDSPAGRSGLIVGDILIVVGGDAVATTEDLQAALGAERVDATVTLLVLRGGEPLDLEVTLGERP